MHAHVSYLTENCPACLLMLTVERDAFFELSAAKQKIVTVRIQTNLFKLYPTKTSSSPKIKSITCLFRVSKNLVH